MGNSIRVRKLTMCGILFAATKRKSPTARLKPGSPQNLFPCQLAWNTISVRLSIIPPLLICERVLMSLHSFGGLLKDLMVSWLILRGQRVGFCGIAEQVKDKRWAVVCHVFSRTLADTCIVASPSPRGEKVGGEKVHLEYRVTWKRKHMHSQFIQFKVHATVKMPTFVM